MRRSTLIPEPHRDPRDGSVLIALASWSGLDEVISLALDRAALGLGADVTAVAPAVAGLQGGGPVDLSAVRVPANQGLWVVVAAPEG